MSTHNRGLKEERRKKKEKRKKGSQFISFLTYQKVYFSNIFECMYTALPSVLG